MPIIRVDYDSEKISESDVRSICAAIRDIVSDVTNIEDVFVYGNNSEIKIKVAPIEVFVEMSAHKIKDLDVLTAEFVSRIKAWKERHGIKTPINFSVIPMPWKVEIEV